jgi:hypothetical protein
MMTAVATMHEQVNEGTGEEKEVRKDTEEVSPVLRPQQERGDDEKQTQSNEKGRVARTASRRHVAHI